MDAQMEQEPDHYEPRSPTYAPSSPPPVQSPRYAPSSPPLSPRSPSAHSFQLNEDVSESKTEKQIEQLSIEPRVSKVTQFQNLRDHLIRVLLRSMVTSRESAILQLHCGEGRNIADTRDAGFTRYLGIDISASAIKWAQLGAGSAELGTLPHKWRFIIGDCHARLAELEREPKFDLVTCLSGLQHSWSTELRARALLMNAAVALRAGGYFVCITLCSPLLLDRVRTAPDRSTFGNTVYQCTFSPEPLSPPLPSTVSVSSSVSSVSLLSPNVSVSPMRHFAPTSPFGLVYSFRVSDAGIGNPLENLVALPTLERMAFEYGLVHCATIPFANFLDLGAISFPSPIRITAEQRRRLAYLVYDLPSTQRELAALYQVSIFSRAQ